MPLKKLRSSCEIPPANNSRRDNRNRHYRFNKDFTWNGVKTGVYKTDGDDWRGILRQTLVGERGETAKFHLRYFEIEPGGYSSFETHKHEHVVIGIRGRGRARISRRIVEVKYLDVLYINPETPHRLFNPYEEQFGFFCIVNAKRDRPRPVRK